MGILQIFALALGNAFSAQVVIGDHFAGRQVLLVVLVHVENGLAALGLLAAVAEMSIGKTLQKYYILK